MSTVVENINQAKSDLLGCKAAIIAKGVEIPYGTPTSDYAEKVGNIETGITPTGTIEITENGAFDVTEYAGAFVEVPQPQDFTVDENYTKSGSPDDRTLDVAAVTLVGEVAPSIPSDVDIIGNQAFMGNPIITNLYNVNAYFHTIQDGVSQFGNSVGAFKNCKALKTFSSPNALAHIGDYAFQGCTSLTKFWFSHDSVGSMTIGNYAFNGCKSLTELNLPLTLISIGDYAFNDCTNLTDIYFEATRAEWENVTIGTDAIPQGVTIHCTDD